MAYNLPLKVYIIAVERNNIYDYYSEQNKAMPHVSVLLVAVAAAVASKCAMGCISENAPLCAEDADNNPRTFSNDCDLAYYNCRNPNHSEFCSE